MATSKEFSMLKAKTHFEQVPVEIAKKIAHAKSEEPAMDALKPPKKKVSNGNAPAGPLTDVDESV
jgi:hypothetical protein